MSVLGSQAWRVRDTMSPSLLGLLGQGLGWVIPMLPTTLSGAQGAEGAASLSNGPGGLPPPSGSGTLGIGAPGPQALVSWGLTAAAEGAP